MENTPHHPSNQPELPNADTSTHSRTVLMATLPGSTEQPGCCTHPTASLLAASWGSPGVTLHFTAD